MSRSIRLPHRGQVVIAAAGELSPATIALLQAGLSQSAEVRVENDGRRALENLLAKKPDLLVLGMSLDGLSGLELCRRLPAKALRDYPVIALGRDEDVRLRVLRASDAVDATMSSTAPIGVLLQRIWKLLDRQAERAWQILPSAARNALESAQALSGSFGQLMSGKAQMPQEVVSRSSRLIADAIEGGHLGSMLESLRNHHDSTFAHSMQVGTTMGLFGRALGLSVAGSAALVECGMFHDLGKSAVPVALLNKPAQLDELDWDIMRRHPADGAKALEDAGASDELRMAALQHHERIDGNGYPHGLRRGQVNELGLVCAICDVHAALTEPRAYRQPIGDEQALEMMQAMGGLEPRLLALFRTVLLDTLHSSADEAA